MKLNRFLLRVEELERRENPSSTSINVPTDMILIDNGGWVFPGPTVLDIDTVVGASGTGSSRVRSIKPDGTERLSFNAFESTFTGGITVAAGDFNGDKINDILVGAGAGGGPRVSAFDGVTGRELFSFYAFDAGFAGGLSVATGHISYDGQTDIIVGTLTGSSHVKVFDGKTRSEIASFFAFDGFQGGVNVAANGTNTESLNRDLFPDIFVGTQSGSSHVKVFSGKDNSEVLSFLAFDANYKGGVSVAAGDFNNDAVQDVLVGSLRNANHVKVFNGLDNSELMSFFVDDSTSENTGVNVSSMFASTIYVDGEPNYTIGVGSRTGSRFKVFRLGASEIKSFSAFETTYLGGISVASQVERFI